MKLIFSILITLILSSSLYSQNYWLIQNSPTQKNLRTCFFADTSYGWIGGDSGLIIQTTNGGLNWNEQTTGIDDGIVSIFFLNKNRGYALAWELDNTPPNFYGSRILKTTNGGVNWISNMYPDSNLFLNSIIYLDSLNGHMVGSSGTLLYTTNAGSNWSKGKIDSGFIFGFPVQKVKFYDFKNGFAVGGAFDIAGIVWKTTDSGLNWRTQIVGPEPVNDLHILDSLNIIGVGGDFEYGASKISSSNAGSVWNYSELHVFGIANSIGFRTHTEAWCSLGIVDSFLVSTNSGLNWKLIGTPNNSYLYKIFFIDSLHGWSVGNEGKILKFNSDLINISNQENFIPESVKLFQNYPNPFNPVTIINYELSARFSILIKVYNVLGKEVVTLVNETQSQGEYSVKFNTAGIPSGIYLYTLTASDGTNLHQFSQTKKMIVIK